MKVDFAVINGKVNTMNPFQPQASAVAVAKGRIVAVGSDEEIMKLTSVETQVLDAKQNTVLPGFIDTHVHLMMTGQDATAVYLNDATTREAFIGMLKEKEKTLRPGAWLQGAGYDETQFPEKTLPPIEELDAAFPDRPIFVGRVDAHSVCLNTLAFQMLGIDLATEGVELTEDGRFGGVVRATANSVARQVMSDQLIDNEMRRDFLHAGAMEALKGGVTSLCALEGGTLCNEDDVNAFLKYQDELAIRTILYHQVMDVPKVYEEGFPRIGGCITVDGSMGSRTAAFMEPYADCEGFCGDAYYTQKEIDDFVMEAHSKGMQIAMHTIGDKAIEMLLQAYEKALAKYPRVDHRHRFEHFSVPTYNQMVRAKALGCYIAVQPAFVHYGKMSNMLWDRLGEERVKRSYAFRSLLDMGLPLAGGSDSSVTPISPLLGISAAATHYHPEQNLSIYEGLKLFTSDAAAFTFEEKEKGSIEVGKLGDITIIEGDIWNTKPDDIKDMKILYTIVGGELKYQG